MNLFRKINGSLLLIVVLVFILGFKLGQQNITLKWQNFKPQIQVVNQNSPSGKITLDFKLFWDTWDLLSREYIDRSAIDPQKLYYGAIQGMVAAVGDPYTVFLPPEAQKITKEQLSGSFDGVGIQLGFNKDKRLTVIAPLKGTPAEKAGIRAGDVILEIDKKDATGLSLPEAVAKIRGPRGTMVTLAIFRENNGKPFDIKLTRDNIVNKTVEFKLQKTSSGKTVAYIKLTGFGEKTNKEWDEAVMGALSGAPQGVIVDVRNNPGGLLEGAVYTASEFLGDGTIVIQEDSRGKKINQDVMRQGKMLKLPVAVLINKGSASAAEILAGAIKDRGRGKIIGEQSFGKGTIQSAEDLAQGTGIHITTAKWLTPQGKWLHNVGLEPDIKVDYPEPSTDKQDPQLQKALEILDR